MQVDGAWTMTEAGPSKQSGDRILGLGGFRESVSRPVVRLEAAGPTGKLIVVCRGSIKIGRANDDTRQPLQAFVVGPDHEALVTEHDGTLHCIEVALAPGATRAFFDTPSALGATPVDLADLWPRRAAEFSERVAGAADWSSRFEITESMLRSAGSQRHRAIPAPVIWAWRELSRSYGRRSIRDLAREIGWSDRHFAACFASAVGLRPKAFARRVRFAAACRALDAETGENLCLTAARCGYADQAHMAREFRAFAGCPPSAYQRARFPDLPGISADALVASTA